jgi:hypothetical protein
MSATLVLQRPIFVYAAKKAFRPRAPTTLLADLRL